MRESLWQLSERQSNDVVRVVMLYLRSPFRIRQVYPTLLLVCRREYVSFLFELAPLNSCRNGLKSRSYYADEGASIYFE